ncbi:MAG: heavy-metal-associated domain-containing protein [Caldilineales bacterium]|nr:heavy-metal-associated domain-containing protein [Caldilineales bacterium]
MKKTFTIPTISCGHCLMSIQRELKFVDGVDYLDGSIENRSVLVEYRDAASLDAARQALAEANYAPAN